MTAEMRTLAELPTFPSARNVPPFDPKKWRLVVDGLVAQPFELTYDEVLALPRAAMTTDFECVEGWQVRNLGWEGFPLRAVVDRAQPTAEARFVTFHSGSFSMSLPLAEALGPEVILAHHLHGAPLPHENGAPLRLVAEGKECFFGIKWVHRLEFSETDARDTGKAIALGRIRAREARQGD